MKTLEKGVNQGKASSSALFCGVSQSKIFRRCFSDGRIPRESSSKRGNSRLLANKFVLGPDK